MWAPMWDIEFGLIFAKAEFWASVAPMCHVGKQGHKGQHPLDSCQKRDTTKRNTDIITWAFRQSNFGNNVDQ